MSIVHDEWGPFLDWMEGTLSDPGTVLGLVGNAVAEVTRENFGESSPNRPNDWAPLSKKYAKQVGRTYATLYVTGDLYDSVHAEPPQGASVTVIATDKKASWHQLGEGHNPVRKFFPTDELELTPYCQARIREVLNAVFLNPPV